LIDLKDPAEIVTTVESLANDQETLAKFKINAREKAVKYL